MLEYKLAENAGFCIGVQHALNVSYKLLRDKKSSNILIWGPIIHNQAVIDELESLGAIITEDTNKICANSHVIIRAHGVTPDVVDYFEKNKITFSDATCVYVKKIQQLARNKYEDGYQLIIVGNKDHPEVIGINGWAGNSAWIMDDQANFLNLETEKKICVIVQTTFHKKKFLEIADIIKKQYPNCEIYDTICESTAKRQQEAERLALESDIMLVLGGEHSSNTRKLYDICKEYCKDTFLLETAGDLPPANILKNKKIGITAGASAPDWIIKEVIKTMEEMKKQDGDINFAEEMESSLVTLHTGQTVKGKIIRFNNSEVYVDLGFKSDGMIPIEDFITEENQDPANNIKVGEMIEVFVVRVNDGEGTVLLSKKRVDEKNNWTKIEDAYENKTKVKALVIDVTFGGLIASAGGVRIFVPASQISDKYVDDLRKYLKKSVDLRIIDYNSQKRKFVGSIKALIVEEKKRLSEMLWNEIDVGKVYEGTIKSLTSFGVFVDIGGVDGLVHISELSWGRIRHPSDVVKVGDVINVTVIGIDKEKKKISLGYRKQEDNPWFKIEERYPVGAIVTKKVVRLAPFGAFVELEKGIDALVHVSQISDTRIARPDDVLSVGMEVTAKITELNLETKKISMSIKEVEPIPFEKPQVATKEDTPVKKGDAAAEDELANLPKEHVETMNNTIGDMLGAAIAEKQEESTVREETVAPPAADDVPVEKVAPAEAAVVTEEAPATEAVAAEMPASEPVVTEESAE